MDITSLILSKKYVEDTLAGAGALAGKSAYDIACDNGFKGTPTEWLASLQGESPQIGPAGTWIVNGIDTGVIASPSLAGYATEEFVKTQIGNIKFPEPDLTIYATRKELSEALLGIVIPDVSGFATKQELEQAIKAIPSPDLTPFATKEEVKQAVDSIPTVDLSGYATEKFVQNEINKIDIPETDLTGYATEEFVTKKIAEAELGGDGEVDLSAYYTKTEVDDKFARIEHPTVDLSDYAKKEEIPSTEGLASEQFVTDAIAQIPAPDLSNYATKDMLPNVAGLASEKYVDDAIAAIEMPAVDLSGLATEEFVNEAVANLVNAAPEDLNTLGEVAEALKNNSDVVEALNAAIGDKANKTELEGLASEQYVAEAIAAIEIPEAKADVSVYEISSNSAMIDELIALLPQEVEINQGDVMLVTNDLGVKSAYQYDNGWVACDGNVDASKVIMPFDITLAGSYETVGNLTKTKTGTATFATRGKSVATALQEMLSKREQPSIKTNPSVSLTATNGAKEVGTEVTPTWSASLGAGEYTYGPPTGITVKTWAISDTDGHTASTASGSFAKFTVGDSTSYRITAKATYDAGAIAKDNLGDPSNPTVQIAAGSKSANGSYVSGYRAWFVYVGNDMSDIDSAFVRATTNKGNGSSASSQSNVAIAAGTKRVMVAIPQKYSKSLTSVIDVDGMGLDVFGNFTLKTVNVEGLNGYEAAPYNVWVADNANGMAATKFNLVIS